jgi:hypothetical protein
MTLIRVFVTQDVTTTLLEQGQCTVAAFDEAAQAAVRLIDASTPPSTPHPVFFRPRTPTTTRLLSSPTSTSRFLVYRTFVRSCQSCWILHPCSMPAGATTCCSPSSDMPYPIMYCLMTLLLTFLLGTGQTWWSSPGSMAQSCQNYRMSPASAATPSTLPGWPWRIASSAIRRLAPSTSMPPSKTLFKVILT